MKQITTILIAFLISNLLSAQLIQFQKTYGGAGTDYIWAVAQTSDGGYILAGETQSVGAGNSDAFLTKTDAYGTIQWTRAYGGAAYDWAYMVRQTSDGGFIFVGGTENAGNGLGDIWIVKTTSLGIVSWQKTCGGAGGDSGSDIIQTSDGGYIASGFQNGGAASNDNACLVKLDGSGTIQWVHTYSNGANDDYGNSVIQTAGGGYMLAGESYDNVNFISNALIVKTDANGTVQWTNTYGGTDDHFINSITALPSGDVVVAGVSSQVSFYNLWLAELNPNGNIVWSNSYAGSGTNADVALWLTPTADGGFAVCGRTNSFTVDYAAFLMKTDSTGAPEWSKLYGGTANDRANQVITSVNGGYVLGANSLSFGSGESGYLIKTDSSGSSLCNESIPAFLMSNEITVTANITVTDAALTNGASSNLLSTTQTLTEIPQCFTVGEKEISSAEDLILIYPNPAKETFTIYDERITIEEIEIFSSVGEKVFSQQQITNHRQQIINVRDWRNGIYFARIKTEQGFIIKKLVKQ
jgi:hypothetical protein